MATVSWHHVGPVIEYQLERERAVTVKAQETSVTQYGDTARFLVHGTIWGVDEYADGAVDPRYSYRYRVRARRGVEWGDWSAYIISVGQSEVDIDPPGNLAVARAMDNSQVVVEWAAPDGDFDSFAVQRRDLVITEGSTLFANDMTLADDLSATTLTYTDGSISPGRTYEYRVAALKDGMVGEYTEWARVTPFDFSFGEAPVNFQFVDGTGSRLLDSRREFWMRWDKVDGADDYEVDVLVYDVATGGQSRENYVVTDPAYFRTSYGRVDLRVRGRKQDDDLCGSGADDRCYSGWTGWYGVKFSPKSKSVIAARPWRTTPPTPALWSCGRAPRRPLRAACRPPERRSTRTWWSSS